MTVGGVPGPWPPTFSVLPDGQVAEGLRVASLSGDIEGRTTGNRRPCITHGCPGWFIGVRWETGQLMSICSEGWAYDTTTSSIQVTGGGEVSARFVAPKSLGTPPLPRDQWPARAQLQRWKGWNVNEVEESRQP
jgi:hypothetical protein